MKIDQDTIVQIGSVMFNTVTNTITGFAVQDTVYSESSFEAQIISKWLSPDPLAEEFYDWSPYNFVYNNPIRYNDPTGLAPIDFYNQDGEFIGTDGVDDGGVTVVTNIDEVEEIQATHTKGGTTARSSVTSGIDLPSASIRSQMGESVTRSNSPTTADDSTKPNFVPDTEGEFHEEGGIIVKDGEGTVSVVNAEPGSAVDLSKPPGTKANVRQPQPPAGQELIGAFHVHPKGTLINQETGRGKAFRQVPSQGDIANASTRTGNSYVFVARSGKVYIYNSGGQLATFPTVNFIGIGKK